MYILTAKHAYTKTYQGDIIEGESMTVQGLDESISDIITKFQNGIPLTGSNQSFYDSEVNENFENEEVFSSKEYDLSDLSDAQLKADEALNEVRKTKKQKEEQKKVAEDQELADLRKLKKDLEETKKQDPQNTKNDPV